MTRQLLSEDAPAASPSTPRAASVDVARALLSGASAAPVNSEVDWRKFGLLMAQLVGWAAFIYYFQLETKAFFDLTALAIGGFAVNYFLPMRFRPAFFACLSLAGIALVLGPVDAAWLVTLGLALIGIAHLPLPWGVRIGMLALAGGALSVLRAGWAAVPWSVAVWPVLGSMFMFRMIVYLYDRRYATAPATWSSTVSYFFMLPNVCFPLFPVVDYATYRRSYYDSDRHEIHQVGVHWIGRGLVQLVLYRFVYYYLSMGPSEVADTGDAIRYVISGFMLYLRISGHFHVIVGVLRLFGFNLPETHHLYFLSSSFTDFWRRINIYWKDFMLKVFYFPAYFRLRRRLGNTGGMIASTVFVFVVTWTLHAVQWFWLRGSYEFMWNDVIFWTILCVLVTINALYEASHGRRRSLGARAPSWRERAVLVLKTAATFTVICVLWSLWTSESLSAWGSLWKAAGNWSVSDRRLIPALILGVAGFAITTLAFSRLDALRAAGWKLSFERRGALNFAMLAGISLVGTPELYSRLLPERIAGEYVAVVSSLREVRLSGHDADMVERGYYEQLLNVQNFNSQLWEVYASWPLNWSRLEDTGALRLTGDFLQQDVAPLKEIHFRNATLTTNRWGMRDQDYEQRRPANARRIALIGSSHIMGYGVDDDDVFDARVERELNERQPAHGGRFELLNFAVDGYCPLQEVLLLEQRVLSFEPQVVIHFAHGGVAYRSALHLAEMARLGIESPYLELTEIAARAGISRQTSKVEAERLIRPFQQEILGWAYGRFAERCRAAGARPVWMFLPVAGDKPVPIHTTFRNLAEDAGYLVLDLTKCYDGHAPETIWFGTWDKHPNTFGHELIAEEFSRQLLGSNQVLQSLGVKQSAAGGIRREN